MKEENRLSTENDAQKPVNEEITNEELASEENVSEEKVNKESVALKVGLGVAAVAATGAVAARSMRNNSDEVVTPDPSMESVANVDPNENLPGETFSDESVVNSHGTPTGASVAETSPSDVYVHTVDENGNESVTHYQDYDNDGQMDQYEVYDSEGNQVDQGAVVSTSTESDVNNSGSDMSDISFYPENDIYDEDQVITQNDPDIMADHENQPDEGGYEGIDWEAVENGSMDEIAVNDATGADGDDVLANNDEFPGYDDNGMGFNDNVADNSDEYILDENELNSVDDYGVDDNELGGDDYALNDSSLEDFGSEDYSSDDYSSDDYSSDDYSSDDYSSDDYNSDDYSSGLEDLGC
ncbi:MAG: hypothetical protein EBS09_11210 [Flavobacteriia bacterium]|nr:hypothetical protein [Flavobacteriia bacterium]